MRGFIALFFAFWILSSASAAEIKATPAKDNRVLITVNGELSQGDADIFKATVKAANDNGKFVSNIRLNSIGGNLVEGVKLADAVRFGKISTNVGKNAVCASACFLIFAAGSTKYANYTAKIGVHGASDQAGEEVGDATVSMARVAKELGVPSAIIGRMVVTPPSDMVWLTPPDLQSMGTTMVGQPSQIAGTDSEMTPTAQTKPDAPTSLAPNAKATSTPTWEEFTRKAIAQSALQNNGKPRSLRSCQPEFKTCWDAVVYTDAKGTVTFAKVTRDIDEKIVRREVCQLNATSDIRKCFDWDRGNSRRDMKDSKGDWTAVTSE